MRATNSRKERACSAESFGLLLLGSDVAPAAASRSRRASTSAASLWRSSASPSNSSPSAFLSAAIRSRRRACSCKSSARVSTSSRSSGRTAPIRMAARTAESMSSGCTSTAGGGLRPMRWSAASTSAINPRRASSDRRMAASLSVRSVSLPSVALMRASSACALRVVSISEALSWALSCRSRLTSSSSSRGRRRCRKGVARSPTIVCGASPVRCGVARCQPARAGAAGHAPGEQQFLPHRPAPAHGGPPGWPWAREGGKGESAHAFRRDDRGGQPGSSSPDRAAPAKAPGPTGVAA